MLSLVLSHDALSWMRVRNSLDTQANVPAGRSESAAAPFISPPFPIVFVSDEQFHAHVLGMVLGRGIARIRAAVAEALHTDHAFRVLPSR